MSYILEALKKSEQERGHGHAPGIQSVHSSGLNYHATRRSLWPWILIAVVTLNLAVLLYFVFDRQAPMPVFETTAADITSPEKSTAQIQAREIETSPASTGVTEPPRTEPAESVATAPVKKIKAAENNQSSTQNQSSAPLSMRAVDIMQLPDNVRQQIPDMEFSAHVYSSNPVQRSVVINGRFMEEGDSMNDDFVLKEITSTGVIMDFRGTYSTPVLSPAGIFVKL